MKALINGLLVFSFAAAPAFADDATPDQFVTEINGTAANEDIGLSNAEIEEDVESFHTPIRVPYINTSMITSTVWLNAYLLQRSRERRERPYHRYGTSSSRRPCRRCR